MKFRNEASSESYGMFPSYTTVPRKPHKRQAQWIATVCLGMLFGSLTLRASADTAIFLYDANAQPVNVTASYVWQTGYLYEDSLAAVVGTVDDSGNIYDLLSGQLIGYILVDGAPPVIPH